MDGYFEDASSIDYSLTQKYPFYSFINSSWQNEFPMSAHWHYYVEILYALEGHGKVIVNGYSYDFYKGDILFTFPRDVHTINTIANEPLEYVVIKLNPDMLFNTSKEAFMFKHFRQLLTPIPPEYQLNHHIPNYDSQELKEIHDLFMNRPHKFEWLVKGLIFKFFYAYSNYLKNLGYDFNGTTDNMEDISSIKPAFEFIHNHYSDPLTAARAADHCHLSYSYFSRQFKKITGISFTQYLNFIRINEAEKLLLDREATVTDVGYKVGFADTSYFIRQFKSHKKMTPKKFLQLVSEDF